jgi:Ni/Fe-hydrogenase subunit HybB-like protein
MMGLSMVSLETTFSGKAFKHKVDKGIISGLAKGNLIVLCLYLILKLFFLAKGPGIGAAFVGGKAANMYLLEMVAGIIIPLAMLSSANMRQNLNIVTTANILVVGGVLLNRMNVAISGMYGFQSATGASYWPSWIEVIITLAIIALGIFLFKLTAKYLNLFPEAEMEY